MGLVSDGKKAVALVRKAVRNRSAVIDVRRTLAARPQHPPFHYRVAVYFADGAVNMYQMRQWYKPLAELAKMWPVVVLSRTATGARGAARRGCAARRLRADGARSRALHRQAGHPRRAVRQPEHAQLPDVPVRAPVARVHQPRRVRQDVHDHQPVQGVRLRDDRGRRRARAALAGAVGLRHRSAHDRDRPSAGRPLLRNAAVHAGRAHRRAVRADVGGRPAFGALRLHRHARRGARACASRHRAPPRDLSPAPAIRRGRPRVRRRQPAHHRGDRRGECRGSAALTTSSTTDPNSAGSCLPPTWRSSTSRRWSTTGSPPTSRS